MQTFSAPLLAAMTARYGKACHLLRIDGGAGSLYWTDAPVAIPYDDGDGLETYVQQWFVCGDVVTDDQGNQAVELTFPDINQIVRGLLMNEDWSKRASTLREAWFDPAIAKPYLDPAAALVEARILCKGRADVGKSDFENPQEPVTIAIVPDADAEGSPGPGQTFQTSCRYLDTSGFKGIQCGYAGVETTCDGSFARCTALANTPRFGGSRFAPKPGSTITVYTIGTR